MIQRPQNFRINRRAPLASGLVFAGLGGFNCAKTLKFADSSGYGRHGTLTNYADPAAGWVWSEELGRWVTEYDGSNDQVVLGTPDIFDIDEVPEFTFNIWSKTNVVNTRKGIWGNIGSSPLWGIMYEPTAVLRWFRQGNNGVSNASITQYQWHNITVRASNYGGSVKFWIDGVEDTATISNPPVARNLATTVLGDYATGAILSGALAAPLFYHRQLTPAEIQQLADPSNVMLSGLILPPTRRLFAVTALPLDLADDTFSIESPYAEDDPVGTAVATGGSTPYSYSTVSAELSGGLAVLKVTGTLSPDATGTYIENGTYNGEPAYERRDGAYWIRWDGLNYWEIAELAVDGPPVWQREDLAVAGDYDPYVPSGSTGTATVALAVPFKVASSTGAIAINDPDVLAVGDTWEVVVRVTDALSATDDGTFTVELVAATGGFFARRYYDTLLAGSPV